MQELFLALLNRGIAAGWLVLAVIVLRLVLRRAPRGWICVLWAMVAVRLLLPALPESPLSLIPSAETVPPEFLYAQEPAIHSGVSFLNMAVNPVISESLAPDPTCSVNPAQILIFAASWIWAMGVAVVAGYALVSTLRLRRQVQAAVWLRDGLWVCDEVDMPFILGVIRPRIYLPSDLPEEQIDYVAAHEKAHLARGDHWWKPLGFGLLAVFWFQPLLWLGYALYCRDLELACDERVIRNLGDDGRRAYSHALLHCSTIHRAPVCPLAFGEVGIKARIRAVLHYRKPTVWILAAAVLLCAATVLCFLTDPGEALAEPSGRYVTSEVLWLDSKADSNRQTFVVGEESLLVMDQVTGEVQSVGPLTRSAYRRKELYALFSGNAAHEQIDRIRRIYAANMGDDSGCLLLQTRNGTVLAATLQNGVGQKLVQLEEAGPFGTTYLAKELLYDAPFYSYYIGDLRPEVRLTGDRQLLIHWMDEQEDWTNAGVFVPTELNKVNFDDYFMLTSDSSLTELRKENDNAWYLDTKGNRSGLFYYLLEQKNGDLYLIYGFHKSIDGEDKSHFRWVFRLTQNAAELATPEPAA